MGLEDRKLEMFFLPWIIARSHTIQLIEIARLFAAHGVKVSIITTRDCAKLFQKNIERDQSQGLDIKFHTFKMPEGCEKLLSMAMSEELFFEKQLREPVEQLLEERRPDCLVSDMFYPWTVESSDRLGIPTIVFHISGLCAICCEESVRLHAPHEKVDSDTATFVLPGLPNPNIKFTRPKIACFFKSKTEGGHIFDTIVEAEQKSYGAIVNSFYELEPAYIEHFKNDMGRKLWLVGPLSLFNKSSEEKAERGQKNSIDGATVLNWLNSKEPKSVIYAGFGSVAGMAPGQLFELACGFEASGHPFIWAAGNMPEDGKEKTDEREGGGGKSSCGGGRVLPQGFEERMTKSGKGLIIRGWAPQQLILEHPAVGGFLTHCGWNSALEGIVACLPMITWPLTFEQFFNENLITDELKIGIRVGNEEWMSWHGETKVTVTREKVEKAVKRLMGGGDDEVEALRRRVRELSEKGKKAVDQGGSSRADVIALINELKSHRL